MNRIRFFVGIALLLLMGAASTLFVVDQRREDGGEASCLLVDTGPAPFHDYSKFDFAEYWERVVPEKIKRYRAVGYI